MEWTGPNRGDDPEAIILHLEYADTAATTAGETLMWANAGSPGNADQSSAALGKDLTGTRVIRATSPLDGDLQHHRIAGVALDDIPARASGSLATQVAAPIRVLAWGVTTCTVHFNGTGVGAKDSFTPLYADTNAAGTGRLSDTDDGTLYSATLPRVVAAAHQVVGYTAESHTTAGDPEIVALRCFIRCL